MILGAIPVLEGFVNIRIKSKIHTQSLIGETNLYIVIDLSEFE